VEQWLFGLLMCAAQIANASKLKGMSKKQLRMVKKTRMNSLGQVELVSPWAKNTQSKKKK
jgi:hypothetical protein